ncbi:uncharacterized protein LOC129221575 [Uloborus diversus]|uniref:uncharacterized protein LOC129221575 n=1 Tax=Uloborus diversus TaxID=327109 RepID=UPI00240A0974|nr:uncharacterized protein LOC129221575 [Uloborus diversus]
MLLFSALVLSYLSLVFGIPATKSAVFDLRRGFVSPFFPRPFLGPSFTKTEDTYRGSLKSFDGKTSVRILGNAGGRLPYDIFGAAEGGVRVDFWGKIVSSLKPYLAPFRLVTSKSTGNASSYAWSSSRDT